MDECDFNRMFKRQSKVTENIKIYESLKVDIPDNDFHFKNQQVYSSTPKKQKHDQEKGMSIQEKTNGKCMVDEEKCPLSMDISKDKNILDEEADDSFNENEKKDNECALMYNK